MQQQRKQVAIGLVWRGSGKLLITKKPDYQHPGISGWYLPGGPVSGPAEYSLASTIEKQTGISVSDGRLLGKSRVGAVNQPDGYDILWFLYRSGNGTPSPGSGVADARFVKKIEAARMCGRFLANVPPLVGRYIGKRL